MVKLKRQLAILLSFCILFGTVAFSANISFKEDNDYTYLKYIGGFIESTPTELDLILNDDAGYRVSFRPDAELTRAQGAKMLSYVLNIEDDSVSPARFNDVSKDYWGYSAITALSSAKILNGYDGNLFKPDSGLTRAEFCVILSRILQLELPDGVTDAFNDLDEHWAAREVTALTELDFINGYSDSTFRPNKYLTRAEAVKLINKAVKIEPNYNENREFFYDLTSSHWAYYDVMAASSPSLLEVSTARGNTKFEDIKYIDLDLSTLTEKCDKLLDEFETATAERKAEIYFEFIKMKNDIATAYIMTEINTARNVMDETYKDDKLQYPDVNNMFTEKNLLLYEKLINAESDDVFTLIGIDRYDLERPPSALDQELIDLLTEENKLISEFDEFMFGTTVRKKDGVSYTLFQAQQSSDRDTRFAAFTYYEKNYTVLGKIFDDLVKVRSKMADYFGIDNFIELGYIRSQKSQYTIEDTEIFRNDVKKYIVPLFKAIISAGDNKNSIYMYPFPEEIADSVNLIEETMKIINNMSPQTKQALTYMQDYNMFDLYPRDNKEAGGFSAFINEQMSPFMFINQSSKFAEHSTFTHEFGHCLQSFRTITEDYSPNLTFDTAEIASQSMEALLTNAYTDLFGEDNGTQYELNMLMNIMYGIIDMSFAEEFQIKVYQNPNMTIEQRNKMYIDTRNKYFDPYDPRTVSAYKDGIIWDNAPHIFERPFYAIDYALSATTALQIWSLAKTDFDSAFEMYMNVIESPYNEYGIEAVTVTSGLTSPFEEGMLESISDMLKEIFTKDASAETEKPDAA